MEATQIESGQIESGKVSEFGEADATRHLRDHLECARKLAQTQDVPVVQYLIQMAILALSGCPAPSGRSNGQ